MGWTHAFSWCQRVLEHAAEQVDSLTAENRLVDGRVAPLLNDVVHTEYVDNFVAFSQGTGGEKKAAEAVCTELQRAGHRCHPVEAGDGGESLGWAFSCDGPLVSTKSARI